jgi:tetratricopeptide (TPR) repeat protein
MTSDQNYTRSARCQKIREAEGLVELVSVPAARLGLRRSLRHRLALRALRAVIHLSPPAGERWRRDLVIGQSLRLLGRFREAVGPLLAAVRKEPDHRSGWIALGWCLRRIGQVDRAAGAMAQAVSHIPDDAVLHYNFACYLALIGQPDLAISELLWALDLNPELRRRLARETDFDRIRTSPSFQALSCKV